MTFHGETIFTNNTGRQGGAIFAYSQSSLEFEGNASFVGNSAEDGGAINLKERSLIHLKGGTRILFRKNRARTYGGAIYVEDAGFWINQKKFNIICFIIAVMIKVEGYAMWNLRTTKRVKLDQHFLEDG